jgi:hypothetical protein
MNAKHLVSISISILLVVSTFVVAKAAPARTLHEPNRNALEALETVPLGFEASAGQASPGSRFVARGAGHALALGEADATFAGPDGTVRMRFGRASSVAAEEQLPGVANYLIGDDPNEWRLGVATYARVRYEGVAPGVDLVFYGTQTTPEYDFVVAPGADPAAAEVTFEGAKRLWVDESGDLLLATAAGEIRQPRPIIYQETADGRVAVSGSYRVEGARVGFQIGSYDLALPLVIDPALKYATYLGGNADDRANDADIDGNGNFVVVGQTLSTNFPTQGAFQTDQSGMDGFVTKLNQSGTGVVFSTYIGGNSTDNFNGVDVDSSGRIFLAGSSSSGDYPAVNAYDGIPNSLDAVLTVLSSTGNTILYSTGIGGSNNDIGNAVAVDVNGNAYLAGETLETSGLFGRFPTKSPSSLDPFQDNYGGGRSDAFVCKFDPDESGNSSLVYSTLLGGSEGEGVEAITVDEFERAYVCGYTESTDFDRLNAIQNTYGGGTTDAFVTKFNADGTTIFYSTFHGGSAIDEAFGIALDTSSGSPLPVVVGHTTSSNLPTQLPVQPAKNGPEDAFVLKLNDAGTSRVFATYFGGPGNDAAHEVTVDATGASYFTGFSNNSYPLVNPVPINGTTFTTGVTITKMSASGTVLVSTCVSAGNGEGIAVDGGGNIYVAGTTSVSTFPVTPGAFQTTFAGAPNDAFAFKLDLVDDDTIGVFKPGTRQFQLRDSNTAGGADVTVTFGVTGDKPIVGDWDGDGDETIGVYTPSTGTFSLRNTNTPGPADITFTFGAPNLVPISGDWDGDGVDSVGVYDPAGGGFFLTNGTGTADFVFSFGTGGATITPVAGDWDGDGDDTVGLFVTTSRNWLLRNENAGGGADFNFVFGPSGSQPVTGDWNGDGVDTIGVFAPPIINLVQTRRYLLRNSNTAGIADLQFNFGVNGDLGIAGNWDGD